jgi:hypothetical protein
MAGVVTGGGVILPLMRLAGAWFLMVLCLAVLVPARAGAAAPAGSGAPVSAKLVAFPPWMGPGSDVTATVAITNQSSSPVSGISIHIEVFNPASSRSQLGAQLSGKQLTTDEWADSEPFPDVIPPGQTRLFDFDLGKTFSAYSSIADLIAAGQGDRAFPARFTIDLNGVPETSVLTELVYFQEPQVGNPLKLALVIPLDAPATLNAQGQETSRALESAIAPGGRIAKILDALSSPDYGGAQVSLAPTGELLDALKVLSSPNGFVRVTKAGLQQVPPDDPAAQNAAATLRAIDALVTRGEVRLINTPYSFAPLPALLANGFSSEVSEQVQDGASTIRDVLPNIAPLAHWLLPSDGLIDDATLGQLAAQGWTHYILAPGSLQQPSPPPALTPDALVIAEAPKAQATAQALVEDTGLGGLLDGGSDLSAAQMLQQFLADSATIQQERPGVARTVTVVTPPDWNPDPVLLDGVLAALAPVGGAPWLAAVTPDAVPPAVAPPVRLANATVSNPGLATPGKEYFDTLRAARQHLDEYKSLAPPASKVDELTSQLLVAEGGQWWQKGSSPSGGEAYARYVTRWIEAELAKIHLSTPTETFTLTSKTATIPLSVYSGVAYRVKVVLSLASDKLTFPHGAACPGETPRQATCVIEVLQPRGQTINVKADSDFTGRLPVQVQIRSLNNVIIFQGSLFVRSTAYNVVALGIVGAAAAFLLGNWAWGFLRRRLATRVAPVLPEAPPLPAPPETAQ